MAYVSVLFPEDVGSIFPLFFTILLIDLKQYENIILSLISLFHVLRY